MIILTLSNGKRVANFSSPHSFEFEDGTILPAKSNIDSLRLSVLFTEEVINDKGDISLSFQLTEAVLAEIKEYMRMYRAGFVDVVFCPLPMITAIHKSKYDVVDSPFRSIRRVNRINNIISISKQCI